MKISRKMLSMVLAVVMALSCLTICAYADETIKEGIAFVDATALRLRSRPTTDSSVIDTAYDEEVVVVLEKTGEWYKVLYNLQEGFMHEDYLEVATVENAELGYGEINAYCVNLRSGPSTSHSIVTQAYEGAKAYILGINEGWYKVIYNEKTCYVRSDLLDLTEFPYENRDSKNSPKYFKHGETITTPGTTGGEEGTAPEENTVSGTAVVTASALHLRASASTSSASLTLAYRGETVSLLGQEGQWYKVSYKDKTGYMHGDYLSLVVADLSQGEKIAKCAEQYLGVPYVWGGSSPSGFDCSGFVQYVYRECGIKIGRTVTLQWGYGELVDRDELQPGDLVFFANTYTDGISHIGIYIGDDIFIHASSNGGVKYNDLNSSYYSSHYHAARRVV